MLLEEDHVRAVNGDTPKGLLHELVVAIAPTIASQLGEGLREWLRDRRARERAERCEHGRPGGRLCAPCADARERASSGPDRATGACP